ncbi:hypothetical protein [Pseudomonas sp. BC115LW]|uniref:hypothetical protein n=1 Tax=Pseudomonas sp. BC115LW TaxID=2683267 RepID=UPI001412B012|nr:hypothetical protein [Pseudomonas sp. BC115LW]NBB33768.1 hypothetical protein [Pseudomonas sp. BC115LW]
MVPKNDKKLIDILNSSKTNKTLKISDVLVTAGLATSGIPGAEAIWNFAKLGTNSIKDYLADRSESKVFEFHRKLLLNDKDIVDDSVLQSTLEMADYHALLQACLSDIEDEKTTIYGNLAKAIARNVVPKNLRRHFILTLKEINWDQLDLLARVYVLSQYNIMPQQGIGRRKPSEAISAPDPYSAQGIDSSFLKTKSLVDADSLTPLGKSFIEACLSRENLEPELFGYKRWTGTKYSIFVLDELHGTVFNSCHEIENYYRQRGVEGGTGPMEGSLDRFSPMLHPDFFLIAYQNGKKLPEIRTQNLLKVIGKRPALQIIYMNNANETPTPIIESDFLSIHPDNIKNTAAQTFEAMAKILPTIKENKK